jgi:SRSO17 transposase
VARNVLTQEIKYFVANGVPGEKGVTLRWLLSVAFRRCVVEQCFREAKEELGMDHYEVRGWRCVHRHYYVAQLSQLFCARVRQECDDPKSPEQDRLTVEQVRSAMNVWLSAADTTPAVQKECYEDELKKQRYHQRRNNQSRKSHTKTKIKRLNALGIDVSKIKSCLT